MAQKIVLTVVAEPENVAVQNRFAIPSIQVGVLLAEHVMETAVLM